MKRVSKSLLKLEARTRTTQEILENLGNDQKTLRRFAGVVKSISEERLHGNTRYWLATLKGWADRLETISTDLAIVQTELMSRLME